VSGAGAYSTLGWFADPILSTMTRRGEAALAAVLFHELAPPKLYVPSDTAFNESYATAIERIGVAAWFTSRDYPHAGALAAYHERVQRRQAFLRIVAEGKSRLEAVYAGSGTVEQKLKAKEAVFTQMRRAYADTVERWGGHSPYAAWFAAPLNNAKLALVSTYSEHVHALMQLYQDVGFDVEAFQRAAVALGELSTQARRERLSRLANGL
jgi:predicted aminopeptidase